MELTKAHLRVAVLVVSALVCSSCLTETDLLLPFDDLTPKTLQDGWTISTPTAEGLDIQKLTTVFRDLHDGDLWQLRSLLVFRHGHLVAEDYFKDPGDLTHRRAIWSCTKQVVGILVGIGVEKGIIGSVDDPLSDYFEEILTRFPDKADITIENLLEMRSGIAYSNDGASGQTSQMLRRLPDNSLEFILKLPMDAAPGTVSHYADGVPHLLSLVMQRRTGRPLDAWAAENLFDPIGFENYEWVRYRDGSTLGGFGILTAPREMAKIAQLVLNDGRWAGAQIVDSTWVREMTAPRVDSYRDEFGFGYMWWYHRRLGVPYMNGHGGQYAFLDRATGVIMVMTAEPNTQDDFQIQEDAAAEIFERILATVTG